MARDRDALHAWLLSALTLALVLSPLCQPPGADSFPISSYPMFAVGRAHAITDVHHLLALDAAGDPRPIPPRLIANDEVLQADVSLRRAVRGGRSTRNALCRRVAMRISGDPAWRDVVRLELRSDRYDALRYFAGDTAPLKSRLQARCAVKHP